MKTSLHASALLMTIAIVGCSSEGPTRPDWQQQREPPSTIEAQVGAHTYTCIRAPKQIGPVESPPVYICH